MFNCHYITMICLTFYAARITCLNGPFTFVSVWRYQYFACSKKKIWQKSPGVKEMWDLKAEAVNFHMWFPLVWLGNEVWGESRIGHCASEIFLFFCESPLIHGHALDTKKWRWKICPTRYGSRYILRFYVRDLWQIDMWQNAGMFW